MSRNIDTDIVELRFDNRNFEKNVKTSQNTLNNFKKSINFDNAPNSIMRLSAAFKSVTLGNIESSLANLNSRFSTVGIVGMRVIQNLTDSAMGLIHRVSNFVVSGIKNGGISRAMNLENANFQLLGLLKTEDKVEAVMQNVNDSVDGTAYSLDAAASVASQLAASGMEAGDDMFKSLRAVAGVAAMTNSEYSDIGRIFTQVAGQGRLMGDQLLQLSGRGMNAAATLAEYLGTDEATVREMVSAGQIDFQTFADAMDDAFGEHAKKANETFNGAMSNVKSALGRIGALFVAPLIKQNGPLVNLFNNVRVKVNEVKDAVVPLADVTTKEINQIIKRLGKLVAAFDLKKPLNVAKNALSIFGSKWSQLETRINSAGISTEDFQKKLIKVGKTHGVNVKKMIKESGSLGKAIQNSLSGNKDTDSKIITETLQAFKKELPEVSKSADTSAKKLEYFQKVVNQVWRGDFKNGEERVKALTKAGYDYNQVQKLVNKTVDGHKLTLEDLSDVELKNVGYTNEEIKVIRKLAKEAEKSGTPINELIADLSNPNSIKGSAIDSAKNILSGLKKLLKVTKNAFGEIFPAPTGASLLNIAVAIEKITEKLDFNEKTGKKLQRTLKGLFALIDMISYILGGGLKVALKVVSKALGIADVDLLSITASLGDFIVKIRDWVRENTHFEEAINEVSEFLGKGIVAFKAWIKELKKSDNVPRDIIKGLVNGIKSMASFVTDAIKGLSQDIIDKAKEVLGIHSPSKEFFSIGSFTIQGLIAGMKSKMKSLISVVTAVARIPIDIIGDLFGDGFKSMIEALIDVIITVARIPLDLIRSLFGDDTSKENAKKAGTDTADSFGDGLKEGAKSVVDNVKDQGSTIAQSLGAGIRDSSKGIIDIVKSVINKVLELVQSIDISQMLAVVFGVGLYKTINNITKAFSGLTAPLEGLGNFLTGLGKSLEANAVVKKSKAVLNLAKAVMILAAAVYLIARVDSKRLWECVGVIGALAGGLAVIAEILAHLGGSIDTGIALFVVGIAAAVLLLSSAIEKLSTVENVDSVLDTLTKIAKGIIAFVVSIALVGKALSKAKSSTAGLAVFLIGIGVSMLLMVGVIKMASGMSESDINKGTSMIMMFSGLIAALVAVTKHSGDKVYQVGVMMILISTSMMLMLGVIQIASMMDEKKLQKGLMVVSVMTGLVAALVAISKFAGKHVAGAGAMMLGVSVAFISMAVVLGIVGNLDPKKANNGLKCMTVMTALIAALIAISKFAGPNAVKAGVMMVTISGAMIAMAALIFILGMLDPKKVKQGLACILSVGVLFGAYMGLASMVDASAVNPMIAVTIGIGLLLAALIAMTFIDTKKLIPATAAVTSVLIGLAALMVAISEIKKTSGAVKTIASMIILVAMLTALIYVLSLMKVDSALKSSIGLSSLMASMALVIIAIKEMPSVSDKTIKTVANMGVVITEIGIIAILLALIATESGASMTDLIGVSAAIGLLFAALAASMIVVEKIPKISKKSVKNLAIIALVVLGFGAIISVLSSISGNRGIDDYIGLAAALGILLTSLSSSLYIASKINVNKKQVTSMMLMGLVFAELAYAIKLVGGLKTESTVAAAAALSVVMIALSQALIPLSVAGKRSKGALKGIAIMNVLMLSLATTFSIMGQMANEFPGMEDGMNVLSNMIANLVVTLSKVLSAGLVDIVKDLLLGLMQVMPIIAGIVAAGIPIIKMIINAFAPYIETAVDFLFKTFQKAALILIPIIMTLMSFAEKVLAQFIRDIAPVLKFVMQSIVDCVKQASDLDAKQAIIGLGVVVGGLLGVALALLLMKKGLKGAAALIVASAGIKIFVESLIAISKMSWEDIGKAFAAIAGGIVILAAAAALLSPILPAMITLAGALALVGGAILASAVGFALFVKTLERIGKLDDSTIKSILDNVATLIPEVMESIGEGLVAFVKTILKSQEELLELWGEGLGVFIDVVIDLIERLLKDVLKMLNKLIPDITDVLAKLIASLLKSLAKYSKTIADSVMEILVNVLKALKSRIYEVVTLVVDILVDVVNAIADRVDDIVGAAVGLVSSILDALGEYLPDFLTFGAQAVANIMEGLVDSVDELVRSAVRIINEFLSALNENLMTLAEGLLDFICTAIHNLAKLLRDAGEKIHSAIVDLGSSIIDLIFYAILGKERADKLKKIGKDIIKKITDGMNIKKKEPSEIGEWIGESIAKAFTDLPETMAEIGVNIVKGLIDGMTDEADNCSPGGIVGLISPIGGRLIKGISDVLDINSPSKEMAKIGRYTIQGLAVGMTAEEDNLLNTSSDIVNAMTESIKQASEIVDANADMSPTIRPVLDLSSVQNGSKQIASMADSWKDITFGGSNNRAFAAVDTAKAARCNPSDDTVDAINALGKKLDAKDDRVSTFTNTFNIKSADPKAAADEVSRIIAKQVERKDAVWA